jgi:hypothetical protein
MNSASSRKRRLLWIVNHKTLLPAEVPILPQRRAVVTDAYDSSLTLPREALAAPVTLQLGPNRSP